MSTGSQSAGGNIVSVNLTGFSFKSINGINSFACYSAVGNYYFFCVFVSVGCILNARVLELFDVFFLCATRISYSNRMVIAVKSVVDISVKASETAR